MKEYYYKVDGLRCIAIFLVLLQHFAWILGNPIYAGFYGVDLFFVISGFLVTGILLKENERSFKENYLNFIGRRTMRIFPIYYLLIFILWLCGLEIVKSNLIYLLTYTFNYALVFKNIEMTPINPFWSLSVEEQFYLFWPIIILSFKKKTYLLLLFIILVITIGYSQQIFGVIPSLSKYNYYSILTRMAPLGVGAFGALLVKECWLPNKILKSILFEYFIFILLGFTLVTSYEFKIPVLGFCSLYLVIKASLFEFSFKRFNNLLKNKQVRYIGTISYGIYLYHMLIDFYFTKYLVNPIWLNINFASFGKFEKLRWNIWLIKFPVSSMLSIMIAALSFKYLETPILKLKEKYFC